MAYLLELARTCDKCRTRSAVVELRGCMDELIGHYCRRCGTERLELQNELERPSRAPSS